MQITIQRSGGFAGVSETVAEMDTARLDPPWTKRVENVVREIRFFDLPAAIETSPGADQFRYQITIVEGSRRHSVTYNDSDDPAIEPLRRLVGVITGG